MRDWWLDHWDQLILVRATRTGGVPRSPRPGHNASARASYARLRDRRRDPQADPMTRPAPHGYGFCGHSSSGPATWGPRPCPTPGDCPVCDGVTSNPLAREVIADARQQQRQRLAPPTELADD